VNRVPLDTILLIVILVVVVLILFGIGVTPGKTF